ncbi:hypothetical protein GCM10009854_08100 [Saccharopolyspora halophila]|uniref:DUF559 domain-containing protein n=1 Tax=Saccharopolyspora halophila TaxID=405551 RepID=A0ABN3FPZ8_9PSEU
MRSLRCVAAINSLGRGAIDGLFTRRETLQDGFTDNDLRRAACHRVVQGVYRTDQTPLTHELRCHAAAMVLPGDAVITGRSAATLHGVPLALPGDPVEVLVAGCKRTYGVRTWNVRKYPFEQVPWMGVQLATPERTALDLLARHPLERGIAYVDALLHAELITAEAFGRFLSGRHDHGIRQVRRGFELLDGRAESIPESVLRVRFARGGLHPVPQLEIPGEFGSALRADLGFEEAKVAVEYEGAWHADREQFQRDERRRAWLRANGWQVVVVTAEDLADPGRCTRLIDEVARSVRERT